MRVAVRHTDPSHPDHGWFAYEQGRITGHRDPITGKSYTAEEVAEALLARSLATHPEEAGYERRIETLHVAGVDENGRDVGEWRPQGESELPAAGEGATVSEALTVEQGQVPASE